MIDVQHPWILVLLAALFVVDRTVFTPSIMPLAAAPAPDAERRRRLVGSLPPGLRSLAVLCLGLVAAGPHRSVTLPGDGSDGVAIMVALDVSESMGEASASGIRRMDLAVEGVQSFLQGREHDLVGLVTFHRTSVMSVPPMLDRAALEGALGRARRETLGDGTALGVAVGFAADRLRAVEARSRVIILVTDGESNAGVLDPVTAARAARALGHRLFVIEVDASRGGSELLRRLAAVAGGRHFPVADAEGLQAAYREIDAMEPTRFAGMERTVELPALGFLVWLAAALFVVEQGLRAAWLERLT